MKDLSRMSKLYDDILSSIGLGEKKGRELYIDSERETKRKELRKAYRFFVEHMTDRSFTDFKQTERIALVPSKEIPIIKTLLFCVVSDREEDKLIAKWMKGKLNCYNPKDFPLIWVLRSDLQTRIEKLYKNHEIDFDVFFEWGKGFDRMLNYSSVSSTIWIRQALDELINVTRPLRTNLNYSECLSSNVDSIALSNKQMEMIIKFVENIMPLMLSQTNYLDFLQIFIRECTNYARKQSIKVLEYASEKVNEEQPDTADNTESLLVDKVNWENILQTSMNHNSSLLPDLCASAILGSLAKEIAEQEFKEKEAEWTVQHHSDDIKK